MVVNAAIYAIVGGYVGLQMIEKLTGHHLTTAEEAWYLTHPFSARKISNCASEAYEEEKAIFFSTGEDDEGDAFRHCFWSALVMRECGQDVSGFITSLHEEIDDNPRSRKDMDLHNNGVGRWRVHMADNKNMSRQVLKLLIDGQLKVIKPNPTKMTQARVRYTDLAGKLGALPFGG